MTTQAPEAIAIRDAERADLLSIYRIERESFPQPWPFQAFEGFLGRPGFLVAVDDPSIGVPGIDRHGGRGDGGEDESPDGTDADDGVADSSPGSDGVVADATDSNGAGEVRGYVVADVVTEFGREVGHVKDLAVASGWRERGIGARLLDRSLSVLAARGARRAKLEVRVDNEVAQSLYGDFGFTTKRVISGYYDDGRDALLLVADLSDRDPTTVR